MASGVGIISLMPASDLPPRTTRLGVFSFRFDWSGGVNADVEHSDNRTITISVTILTVLNYFIYIKLFAYNDSG